MHLTFIISPADGFSVLRRNWFNFEAVCVCVQLLLYHNGHKVYPRLLPIGLYTFSMRSRAKFLLSIPGGFNIHLFSDS